MRECSLEGVAGLRCTEGLVPLWEETLLRRLTVLRSLTLSACGLASIPSGRVQRLEFSSGAIPSQHIDCVPLKPSDTSNDQPRIGRKDTNHSFARCASACLFSVDS